MDAFTSKWPLLQFLDPNIRKNISCLHVYGKYGNNFVFTTNDDKVYYIHRCKYSNKQCVKGKTTFIPVLLESLCGKNIAGFTAGWNSYVVAYTKSGELYSWAHKCYTELNYIFYEQEISNDKENNVVQVLKDDKIINVSCGAYHTAAVTEKGEVYYWGRIKRFKGRGFEITTPQNAEKLTGLLVNKKIVKVASGENFSIILDFQGKVYGWGSNNKGQLAHQRICTFEETPIKIAIPDNKRISNITCGDSHVLALSTDRTLYTWGNNMNHQCGVPMISHYITEPFPLLDGIHEIGASHGCKLSGAALRGYIHVWGTGKGDIVIQKPKKTKYLDMVEAFVSFTDSLVTPQNYVPKEEFMSMSQTLISLFNNKEKSDVTFKIGDEFVYAQKTLLMIRSDYFRKMFTEEYKESKETAIAITQYFDAYKMYLEYLYLDHVNQHLPWNTLTELIELAKSHNEESLFNICQERLMKLLTSSNLLEIYNTAINFEAKDLIERCLQFSSKCLDEVIVNEEFKKLDGGTAKNFIRKVLAHKP